MTVSLRDPEELEAAGAPATAMLSPATTVGAVRLGVTDLKRSLRYYEDAIGLDVLDRTRSSASLGAGGEELLLLEQVSGARAAAHHTGLYHFALLLPRRVQLARWLAHAAREHVPLVGLSDHFVSEAIYLSDPDEHGIEIYWDRPRQSWEGEVARRMTTLPLDVESLLSELDDPNSASSKRLPAETRMGHVHLKVADIPRTLGFYRDVLGFALMAQLGSAAAFLSAGGYHHHLGANTWESAGASPPPEGTASLLEATIVLAGEAEREAALERVRRSGQTPRQGSRGPVVDDPSGNALLLAIA